MAATRTRTSSTPVVEAESKKKPKKTQPTAQILETFPSSLLWWLMGQKFSSLDPPKRLLWGWGISRERERQREASIYYFYTTRQLL